MSSDRISRREALGISASAAAAQPRPQPPAARPAFVDEFWDPFERNIVAMLPIRPGMRILDLGCGAGAHLGLLAERLRGQGEVLGFDLREDRLELARQRHRGNRLITLRQGDLYQMPFEARSFDLVWSSHVFHGLPDIDGAARALRRVLRPGGWAVLREDSSAPRFFPLDLGVGKPGFESRIHQAFLEWFVADRLQRGRYPYGWTHTLETIGLRNVEARSILHEARPPFTAPQKDYIAYAIRRRLDYDSISAEDRAAALAVTDPANPHYALNRRDLHFTATSTIYIGQAPAG